MNVKNLSDEVIMELVYLSEFKDHLSETDYAAHDELMTRGLQGKQYCDFIEWYRAEFGV